MGPPRKEIAVVIMETVSDALGKPPEELPPLSDAITPETLEAVDTIVANSPAADITVSFTYAEMHVIVRSENTVFVQPIQKSEAKRFDATSSNRF